MIAYDLAGNKFTNCTILNGDYGLQNDGVLKAAAETKSTYASTKKFSFDNYKLLELR